jgi:predicted DNA-binding antitoxin AbrB/MazE fold protein
MQAIKGYYENGLLKLDKKAPFDKGRVIVVFPAEEYFESGRMSTSEALQILNKYKGNIKDEIDIEKERDAYLHGKYEATH